MWYPEYLEWDYNKQFYAPFVKVGQFRVAHGLAAGYKDGYRMWQVTLKDVPSVCGSLFFHELTSLSRGQGEQALRFVIRYAELARYSSVECVVQSQMAKMIALLEKYGFKEIRSARYKNYRTNNVLRRYHLILKYPTGAVKRETDKSYFLDNYEEVK